MVPKFSAHVQTVPEGYSTSTTRGTGCFPGVKQQGRGVDLPTSSSAESKERVKLYLQSFSGPSWSVVR